MTQALATYRICDFTGQLAGAGATRALAAFGAEVIRIEDPVNEGRWDILRGQPPYVDERRGINLGGSFNNHNTHKLGITLNLRSERAKELLRQLVRISDAVTENFSAGVLERLGFGYEQLRELKPDIVYVSNSGFGGSGPYRDFKTWGPIVQAISGLTWTSKLRDEPPAGWGYSYMDHTGAYYMCIALLAALHHRNVSGEGQWVDMACTEAGATLTGPAILDYTANGRPTRRDGLPDSNHSLSPRMSPHAIYPAAGEDRWIAIACRGEADWRPRRRRGRAVDRRAALRRPRRRAASTRRRLTHCSLPGRASAEAFETAVRLRAAGVPAAAVARPEDRVEHDPARRPGASGRRSRRRRWAACASTGVPAHLSERTGSSPAARPASASTTSTSSATCSASAAPRSRSCTGTA